MKTSFIAAIYTGVAILLDDLSGPPILQRHHSEVIHAVVEGVVGVAFHFHELHFVLFCEFDQPLPEILILDRLLAGGFPSAPDLVFNPVLVERVCDV